MRLVYDGNVPIQHRDSNNVPTLTLTRGLDLSGSLQGAGGIGGLLAMTESSGTSSFYHNDGGGNVTALINANQLLVGKYLYDPFGYPLSYTGPKAPVNQYWFSSELWDTDTGFLHYPRRVYVPIWQEFLNRDPIGEAGGMNLFRFVENNPVDQYDPFGLTSLTLNGTKYPINSRSDFDAAMKQATQGGKKINSFVFEGHGAPAIGALYVADDHVKLDSMIQAPEFDKYLKNGEILFEKDAKIELKACGSANPNTYSAADAFKKGLPDAHVYGYTGLMFQMGPIETGVPNNKFFANSFWSVLFTPGKGALAGVPAKSAYIEIKK